MSSANPTVNRSPNAIMRFLTWINRGSVRRGDSKEDVTARVTLLFNSLFFGASVLSIFATAILSPDSLLSSIIFTVFSAIFNISIFVLLATNQSSLAVRVFAVYLILLSAIIVIISGIESPFILVLALPLAFSGLTVGSRLVVISTVIYSVEVIIVGVTQIYNINSLAGPITDSAAPLNIAYDIVILFFYAVLLTVLVNQQTRAANRAERVVAQLRTTAQLAQTSSSILELDRLLPFAVNFIRDQFAFYHVQVFLIDADRRYATLLASTGEAGQALLQRGHRLAVGSQSIIGRVTLNGTPVVALDTQTDPLHRTNELLPQTRSELAMPLIVGEQIIGALDVQSTRPDAFTQADIDSLQIVASQVGISIRNAQLFEQQRDALQANERLLVASDINLREIQQLNQRLTESAWSDYLDTHARSMMGVTLQNRQLLIDTQWTASLVQAARERRSVLTRADGKQTISVPIRLGERVIGAMEVETSSDAQPAELTDLVQAVSARLSLSLENARLFEQSQMLAQQELTVNAITAKMQVSTTVDDLLRVTLAELGRALDANYGAVRLGSTLLMEKDAPLGNGRNGRPN
jgi:GAF domain-containing protein